MGEADSKEQREKVKDRFVVVLVAHAVRVTILLCLESEALEDNEKNEKKGVQGTTRGSPQRQCTSPPRSMTQLGCFDLVLNFWGVDIEGLVKTAKKSSR